MSSACRNLVILGSTGSVGGQTLDVVRAYPERFQVYGMAAGSNQELLLQQIEEFRPKLVAFSVELEGHELVSMEEMAAHPDVDIVVVATVGSIGIAATMAALSAGKTVAMANKEIVVIAGGLLVEAARRYEARILPIDNALNSIWQCIRGEEENISDLILTTTGGAQLGRQKAEMLDLTWQQLDGDFARGVGRKLRIDSATMMREGMQIIEAHSLFRVPYENIHLVSHPEGVVPSLVQFIDGSVKATLVPLSLSSSIQYCLSDPSRWPSDESHSLDMAKLGGLTFGRLDSEQYPCLKLALEWGRKGHTYPAVLNGANETATHLFVHQKIGFQDIPRVIQSVLERHRPVNNPTLDDLIDADKWAKDIASQQVPA
ncbi:MAG: 1-deoxy-D-xylulose 5-phosphate reductoisomerase [Dehalococcoidia bacterium]|nr:1-deoxy-D-xylulose 5-phosphate reductoisomerase [Dehalococcoidia bacterium]